MCIDYTFYPQLPVTQLTNEATTEYSHFRNFTLKLQPDQRELAVDCLMDCLYTDTTTTTTTNRKPIKLAVYPAALITASTNIKVKVLTVNNHSTQRHARAGPVSLPVKESEVRWHQSSCFDYLGPGEWGALFRQRKV